MNRLLFILIASLALASCASSGQAPKASAATQVKIAQTAPPTASVLWQASASLKPQFSALAEAEPELLWSSKAQPSIRVASVAYSPDGKTLAVGLAGGAIKLWDMRDGKLLHTLQGHDSWANSVVFTPDGNTLASGSSDRTVKLWDARSGKLLRTFKGHSNTVLSVTFAPDGETLASGAWDDTIKLWDASSGELLRTLKGHTDSVRSVAFAPDGKTLASGSWDETIKLWHASSGELLRTLEGHTDAIRSVAFAPNGDKLASGSHDNTVKLWDASSGESLRTLRGHADNVVSVAFAPDGQTLASGSWDNTVKLWHAKSGELERTLKRHTNRVHSLAFAHDGKTLASGSWDNTVKLWDAASGELQLSIAQHALDHKDQGHSGLLRSVAYSPDGQTLASSSDDHTIKLWNVGNGELLRTLEGHTSEVDTVAFSPDGTTLASGSRDKTIKLWHARSGELLQTLEGHSSDVYSVAFAPDGNTLASGARDKTIKLWDASSGDILQTLRGHTNTVFSVAFAPDSQTLASGSADDTIQLWNVGSGELLQTLEGHSEPVKSVAFNPDGSTLASGSWDNTVKLWDVGSGELLQTLEEHNTKVYSVAFTPDGQTLASGSSDKTIKLWDAHSGELLRTIEGHSDHVYSVAFAPDGQSLASGSFDHTIKRWRVPARERAWNAFVAAYDSGKADLAELSELAAVYPYFSPQHQQLQNYRSDLESLRAAADKNAAVNNYIAQRLRHYYENDAMFEKPEQRTRKTLDFTAQYLEEAMWLAYGAPQIEVGAIPKYDSEQELFHLQLQGQYPQFSQAIAVAMPPKAARALAQDSSAAQVQVSFSVSSKSIDLTEVELSFQEQTYKGTPSSADSEFAWRFPTVIPEVIVAAQTTADPELAQAVDELPAAPPDPRAWLLAIGVEDYMVAPDVPYADNSLELVSAVLAKRFGIPESNRIVLQGEQASGTFIRGNIRNTLGRLGPEDKLYFYYSGHGMPGRGGDQLYLAPRDIVVSAFEDDDFAFATLLSEIQQARVGQVMAFLDTCFSGKAKADELVFPDVAPIMVSAEQEVPEKMTVFYAASGAQFANSYEDKGHRLFSYFLAQGLVDGLGTVEDLERYVSANVAQQARAKGVIYEQIPFVDGRGGQL